MVNTGGYGTSMQLPLVCSTLAPLLTGERKRGHWIPLWRLSEELLASFQTLISGLPLFRGSSNGYLALFGTNECRSFPTNLGVGGGLWSFVFLFLALSVYP